MKLYPLSWQRWLVVSGLAVLVLAGGYYGARHYAWPAVKAWRITHMNREARGFLARGDLSNALLTARKSLEASTQNPEAWRVAAETSAAQQRAVAMWYQDNLCRLEPSRANYLELIRLSLRFDLPAYALGTVSKMAPEARDDPEYHRLAAEVYKRTGQPVAAKFQLAALTALRPTDRGAQLDLAEMELATDTARTDVALRARVLALAEVPELHARALILLLRDNVAGQVKAGTAELVRRLQLEPSLDLDGRLLVIQGLFLLEQPEAGSRLAQLQKDVADKPADVVRVVDFLTRTGRAAEARAWVATLPDASRRDENVERTVAEALLTLKDAPGLESFLRGGHWAKNEYLRQALLAHAYRDEGRSAEFEEAWKLALLNVGTDLRKITALLARADEWRWVTERHQVVWKLFMLIPTNETAQRALLIWERHQGNTANLNRFFTRLVEVQPKDNVALNNLAYTSLLLDANVARSGLIAKELATAEPRNPFFATTYALALFKQGHPAEALARLDALTVSERAEPTRVLLRAMCQAALGQATAASDLLSGVVVTGMLPEEKRLADDVMTEIVRLDRMQGNRSRLLAYRKSQASGAVGWLAVVSAATRKSASTDMQLADSLYATSDWTGLRELLRTTKWNEADYLRTALLAYVYRREGSLLQSDEQWRQTVALADRDTERLQNVRALVTEWKWAPERLETVDLIFARTPGDRLLLAELLRSYRDAGKTADLERVLGLYVGDNTEPTDEAVDQAYFNLLLETNLARAHVVARNAFETAPADPVRRMVYAFSLWKQRRVAEAMPLLAGMPAGARSELVSIPLMRATIQAQMGAREQAQASLAQFDSINALPEEAALAAKISSQLSAQAESVKPPST